MNLTAYLDGLPSDIWFQSAVHRCPDPLEGFFDSGYPVDSGDHNRLCRPYRAYWVYALKTQGFLRPGLCCTALSGFRHRKPRRGDTAKPRAKALGINAPTIKALKGRHRPQGVGPTGVNRIARSLILESTCLHHYFRIEDKLSELDIKRGLYQSLGNQLL